MDGAAKAHHKMVLDSEVFVQEANLQYKSNIIH